VREMSKGMLYKKDMQDIMDKVDSFKVSACHYNDIHCADCELETSNGGCFLSGVYDAAKDARDVLPARPDTIIKNYGKHRVVVEVTNG
jgi:MoaA/NifB/PqqE/SkfB family radical SAM enzyme